MAIHNSKLIFILNDATRCLALRYQPKEEGGKPTLAKTLDPSIEVDDLVVVATDTRFGFTVARVEEVDVDFDIDAHEDIKWIICPVDMEDHEKLVEQEKMAISEVKAAENARHKQALRDSMFKHQEEKLANLAIANYEDSTKSS